jgi:hypothetical protein
MRFLFVFICLRKPALTLFDFFFGGIILFIKFESLFSFYVLFSKTKIKPSLKENQAYL